MRKSWSEGENSGAVNQARWVYDHVIQAAEKAIKAPKKESLGKAHFSCNELKNECQSLT